MGPPAPGNMRRMSSLSCYAKVQYDGTRFCGWQRQKTKRTVQGEIEKVLERLTGEHTGVVAAGRTDTGVHALAQYVSFDVENRWSPSALQRALNSLLPPDIWIASVGIAPPGFNARKDAATRRYHYVIGTDAAARSPFRRTREWALCSDLSTELLSKAAQPFLGEHDFRGYSAVSPGKRHYRCTVSEAGWHERSEEKGIIFEVEADRFLHRMVRFMVGTMIDVGTKRRALEDIFEILETADNSRASPPAPPHGLYLIGVTYPQLTEVS